MLGNVAFNMDKAELEHCVYLCKIFSTCSLKAINSMHLDAGTRLHGQSSFSHSFLLNTC